MTRELIIDSFAGGGGASTGIEMALSRSPDIAINHDSVALAMHAVNHPDTRHLASNIWQVDPVEACGGRPVGLMWASPDCKHFSKAKGGRPVEKHIRDLAWVVVRWACEVAPRVIILENVEEFETWGPLTLDGRPCPDTKGETFLRFTGELRRLTYAVEYRRLRACDYGAPTIRRRLVLIARRDGEPIVWPAPTHGAPDCDGVKSGRLKPWRTAAEIIDWSLPCPSIFATSAEIMARYGIRAIRPLAEATLARIAKGVRRYVIEASAPFIIPITHTRDKERGQGCDEPLCTVTGAHRGEQALVMPIIAGVGSRAAQSPERGCETPFPTVTATKRGQHAVVAAFLAKHYGDNGQRPGSAVNEPVNTITSVDHNAVVSAGLINMKGSARAMYDIVSPVPTICGGTVHAAEVRAFLVKYYGSDQAPRLDEPLHTVTTKPRFGLVTVEGEDYQIVDIGMRMLTPRELFAAQGFPAAYVIDRQHDGTPVSKTDQIRMCGNSVCPPIAAALVAANYQMRDGDYDGQQDFARSLDVGYEAIRARVAHGGPGWQREGMI